MSIDKKFHLGLRRRAVSGLGVVVIVVVVLVVLAFFGWFGLHL
jgi:hypothetical protein